MGNLRLLLEMGKPRILALMCLLALAGAVLSPAFLSPDFPRTRLGSTALFRSLEQALPQLLTPQFWSFVHALGAVVVVGLLWLGTALINDMADRAIDAISDPGRPLPSQRVQPAQVLRWALGAQGVAFLLVLMEGSRTALLISLLGAGLGNAYSLPPFRLRRSGVAANVIIGGGVMLAIIGGMLAQGGATEVGVLSALALGILATALSMVKDFKDVDGDRAEGIRTLPVMMGVRAAVAVNMALVVAAYTLAVGLLIQHTGLYLELLGAFGALAAANLYVLAGLVRDPGPEYARKAYRHVVMIFMGVTVLYVGAQALL